MGTKNNPGEYDCYEKAELDEPMFILLGRDPVAGTIVRQWVYLRALIGNDEKAVTDEALDCADVMEAWARKLSKSEKVNAASKHFLDGRMAQQYAEQLEEIGNVLIREGIITQDDVDRDGVRFAVRNRFE